MTTILSNEGSTEWREKERQREREIGVQLIQNEVKVQLYVQYHQVKVLRIVLFDVWTYAGGFSPTRYLYYDIPIRTVYTPVEGSNGLVLGQ